MTGGMDEAKITLLIVPSLCHCHHVMKMELFPVEEVLAAKRTLPSLLLRHPIEFSSWTVVGLPKAGSSLCPVVRQRWIIW